MDKDLCLKKDISADILDENSYEEYLPFVYFGDGAQKLQNLWVNREAIFDPSIKISATGQTQLALKRYINQSFDNLSSCKPLYLKQFGINT